jgi:hypothetical protein
MLPLGPLLLLTALTISTPALVLKSGERINVETAIQSNGTTVTFRSNGSLFTIPAAEVDFDATRDAGTPPPPAPVAEKKKLTVSAVDRQKLLKDLSDNHSGTPASKDQLVVPDEPRPRTSADLRNGDEWQWRNSARAHEEEVKRAREHLDLLRDQRAELKAHITSLLSLGYRAIQFSYDTSRLAMIEEQIPYAELDVTRAERAQAQFLDDARRQGILPGWLR